MTFTKQSFVALTTFILVTSPLAFSKSDDQSFKLLMELLDKTKSKATPLSSLPQNFGGDSPKLNVQDSTEYNKVAKKLALLDEATFGQVISDVIIPLREMFKSKEFLVGRIASNNLSFKWCSDLGAVYRVTEGISERKWVPNPKQGKFSDFQTKIKEYLDRFKEVRDVELSPFALSTPLSKRDPATASPIEFKVGIRFDIRGKDLDGLLRNDRGTLEIVVDKESAISKWRIHNFQLLSGETLTAPEALFAETNPFLKGKPTTHLRKEAIRRGGYALALNDLNGDGIADLLVGQLGAMELFLGKTDGTFEKANLKQLGLEGETLVKSAVIADFNNDGLNDLLLVRFAPNEQRGKDIAIYENLGKSFKKVTNIKNRYPSYYAMPSAVGDFNEDGLLDFYIGFPGAKDFTVLDKKAHGFSGLKELHPQGLFYNNGKFSFSEVTKEKFPYTKKSNAYTNGYPETAAIFPHSAMAIDYDLNGHMDIVVIDDKANLSPLYKNIGGGTFEQIADKIGLTNYDFGMGFTSADLFGDGKLNFIYTSVNFLAAERIHNDLASNFSDFSAYPGTFGLRIFGTSDGAHYSDITALSGVVNAGEGLAGVEIIDYNNDGLPDIYVANGLWTGTSRDQTLDSLFMRSYLNETFDFQEVLGSSSGIASANTSFMRILKGYEGEVESGKQLPGLHPSMAGFQRNRLFRNNGDRTFTEIGYLAGVDSISDGYMIATSDINRDGHIDLVLRNADPGISSLKYAPVQVFLNKGIDKNKSVILSLLGTASNRNGIGTIADATINGKHQIRHLTANNGAVQSELLLHFGLGKSDSIDELKLKWPSGHIDILKNIPAGRHQIKEGTQLMSSTKSHI